MPTFEVEVEEHYDQVVAEEWRSYRTITRYSLYSIEAESREEAEVLVAEGEGTFLDEDTEYGDTYDSEFCEEGDILNEELIESNVNVIVPRPNQRDAVGYWPGRFVGSVPTTTQQREPDWEV
jgi:hypothetical protein